VDECTFVVALLELFGKRLCTVVLLHEDDHLTVVQDVKKLYELVDLLVLCKLFLVLIKAIQYKLRLVFDDNLNRLR
jgi:hypothetical protein